MSAIVSHVFRVCGLSAIGILILVAVMCFSPLSSQYHEGLERGISCVTIVNVLVEAKDYNGALEIVNSEITEKMNSLPGIAYFDRFLPKEKRYEVSLSRLEIYELQWKRIQVLTLMGDNDLLRQSLKKYTSIIGYHQEDAKEMLNQMEGN